MKLVWDQTGEKYYHTGIEKVVLYPQSDDGTYPKGVAWNGVTNITDSPSGGEPNDIYADDEKYLSLMSPESHGGSIGAYSSPPEFDECDGSIDAVQGVQIKQQKRRAFGLSYVSLVGNDTEDTRYGYNLHLVWGAKASPSEWAHDTVNDTPEPTELSWEYTTTPVKVGTKIHGKLLEPFAHMVIFSRSAKRISELEGVLYGDEEGDARLPLPEEALDILMSAATVTKGDVERYGIVTSDLQENIRITGNSISGRLKCVEKFPGFSQSMANAPGNYLSLDLDAPEGGTVLTKVDGGDKPDYVDATEDGFCVYHIKSNQQKIRVKTVAADGEEEKIFDLAGLELLPCPVGETAFRKDKTDYGAFGNTDAFYKDVKIAWSGTKAVVTGELKYVDKSTQASFTKLSGNGNYFAFALTDFFKGKLITVEGSSTKTVADQDWVMSVTEESKARGITVRCEGAVVATFDLSGVTLGGAPGK